VKHFPIVGVQVDTDLGRGRFESKYHLLQSEVGRAGVSADCKDDGIELITIYVSVAIGAVHQHLENIG
jgi:hypothetical protein